MPSIFKSIFTCILRAAVSQVVRSFGKCVAGLVIQKENGDTSGQNNDPGNTYQNDCITHSPPRNTFNGVDYRQVTVQG